MKDRNDLLALILSITRGIIVDQRARRNVLFYVVMGALAMLVVGTVGIGEWLLARPVLFILFWAACLWLTLLSVVMALFDMLMIRRDAREERKRLRKEIFDSEDDR